jgi:CelD/BcsL family acetyltransferase involved in cellulose biosynthesis
MLRFAPLDAPAWDASLARHQSATLFHTSRWLSLLERAHGVRVDRLGIFEGNCLRGLFPLMRTGHGPFTRVGSPVEGVSTPYLGPLVADELLPQTLSLFDERLRRQHAGVITCKFARPIDVSLAASLHYQVHERRTLLLPLAGCSTVDLWQQLKKNCRAHVRQAQQRGVEIIEAESPAIIEEYCRLERGVFARRRRRIPHDKRFYYALWDALHPAGQMNVLAAQLSGRTIGVLINAWYGGKLYGLYGATDDAYRRYYPGNLLEWHLIEWAVAQGMELYDMIGGTDASFGEFKRSFGAVPMETPIFSCERSRVAALARRMRHHLRRAAARARGQCMQPGGGAADAR